jgi:hypothetical protein
MTGEMLDEEPHPLATLQSFGVTVNAESEKA